MFLREKKNLLNDAITASEVRLIDDKGENHGIVAFPEALEFARKNAMDLVEIVSDANPPVCRVMDYGKYRFTKAKKVQQARKRQRHINVKEIKFRPGTDEADYQTKLKKIASFLSDGDKTKVTVRFRGRELAYQERGVSMLERIQNDLKDMSMIEMEPKKEGRQLMMVLAPGKNKNGLRNGKAKIMNGRGNNAGNSKGDKNGNKNNNAGDAEASNGEENDA